MRTHWILSPVAPLNVGGVAAALLLAALLIFGCGNDGRELTEAEQELLDADGYVDLGTSLVAVGTQAPIDDQLDLSAGRVAEEDAEIIVMYTGEPAIDETITVDVASVTAVGPYRIHLKAVQGSSLLVDVARQQ